MNWPRTLMQNVLTLGFDWLTSGITDTEHLWRCLWNVWQTSNQGHTESSWITALPQWNGLYACQNKITWTAHHTKYNKTELQRPFNDTNYGTGNVYAFYWSARFYNYQRARFSHVCNENVRLNSSQKSNIYKYVQQENNIASSSNKYLNSFVASLRICPFNTLN